MRRLWWFLIALFWVVVLGWMVTNAFCTTYYLKHDGDNDSSGLSVQAAWRTLSYAMSQTCGIQAGDTCFILPDTFTERSLDYPSGWNSNVGVVCSVYGGQNDPIVYKGYGGRPLFYGNDSLTTDFARHVQNFQYGIGFLYSNAPLPDRKVYVILDSIYVKGIGCGPKHDWCSGDPEAYGETGGFWCRGVQNVKFKNCKAESIWVGGDTVSPSGNLAGGFVFGGSDYCTAYACTVIGTWEPQCDGNQEAFNFHGPPDNTCNYNLVRKCYVEWAEGGVQAKSYAVDYLTVDSCTFHQVNQGVMIAGSYCKVAFNIFSDNGAPLAFHPGYSDIEVCSAYNNTIYVPDTGWIRPEWCDGVYESPYWDASCHGGCNAGPQIRTDGTGDGVTDSVVLFNNIVWNNNGISGEKEEFYILYNTGGGYPTFQYSNYNCWYDDDGAANVRFLWINPITLAQWRDTAHAYGFVGCDSQSIVSDPMFVDPENGDFRLASGSPCRTSGKDGGYMGALAPEDDSITQNVTCVETTTTSFSVRDSVWTAHLGEQCDKAILFVNTVNNLNTAAKKDSFENVNVDTLVATGLPQATLHYYWCIAQDAGDADTVGAYQVTTKGQVTGITRYFGRVVAGRVQ